MCTCCGAIAGDYAGEYVLPSPLGKAMQSTTMSYKMATCHTCGHVQAFPFPAEEDIHCYYASEKFWKTQGVDDSFDSRHWYQNFRGNSGLWERYHRAGYQLCVINKILALKKNVKILDLGSGYSPFLFHCRKHGFQNLYALDPSHNVCQFLETQGISTYNMLFEDYICLDDPIKFDIMVISHAIEHLVDPASILVGLKKHLTDDGVLYVDVPFQDHLRPYNQGLHLQFFCESSIRRILENSGYKVCWSDIDHHRLIDRAILGIFYFLYGKLFHNGGGITPSSTIERLHRWIWRPLKSILRLRINIFISTADLRVIARVADKS